MKITYLHQYFNTPTMIGGTRSYELGRRLVAMGHEVHVVTSWREPTDERGWFETVEQGMTVHWLPVPYSNKMPHWRRMQAFVAFAAQSAVRATKLGSDVILATSTPLTIAIPALIARSISRRPMVFEVRDSWPTVPIALGALSNPVLIRAARLLERWAYFGSERVIALSPAMKADVVSTGFPSDHVKVIPNGCDLEAFEVHSDAGSSLIDMYPWVRDRPVITYAGTVGAMNGVDFIVHLAHELMSQGSPYSFAVLGDGNQRLRVQQLAQELGVLNESVRFIGSVPKAEVGPWLRISAATLMTLAGPASIAKYAVQNKFFDYIAAGKPVIANFRGYVSEVAEAHGAGLILSPSPSEAAQELVARLTPDWLALASRRARHLAESQFSRDQHAHELASVLEEAMRR